MARPEDLNVVERARAPLNAASQAHDAAINAPHRAMAAEIERRIANATGPSMQAVERLRFQLRKAGVL